MFQTSKLGRINELSVPDPFAILIKEAKGIIEAVFRVVVAVLAAVVVEELFRKGAKGVVEGCKEALRVADRRIFCGGFWRRVVKIGWISDGSGTT